MDLKSILFKIRYLRHPYLIVRAILLPFEIQESHKHSLMLTEYDQYSTSFEEGVEALTGIEKFDLIKLKRELESSKFLQHINTCIKHNARIKQVEGVGSPVDARLSFLLYVLVRALRPKIVVETGVANGISSSFILKALDKNSKGRLYSVDMHYRDGVAVPFGKHLGWAILQELKHRWSLVLGESAKVLPKLLNELGSIEIFFHDSSHTYKTMMSEYNIVWPFLKDGGLLLSDDVRSNDAFLDFSNSVKQTPLVLCRIGAIRKSVFAFSRCLPPYLSATDAYARNK